MVKNKTKQQLTAVNLCRLVLICKGKEKTEPEKVNILEHSSHWLLHALWSSIRLQSKTHQLSAGWLKTNTKHIEIALYLPFGYAHTCSSTHPACMYTLVHTNTKSKVKNKLKQPWGLNVQKYMVYFWVGYEV